MARRRELTPEEAAERKRKRDIAYHRRKREELARVRVPYDPYTVHVNEWRSKPPEEVLADRDRRMALPHPAFGDPPPGYSALDKRRS